MTIPKIIHFIWLDKNNTYSDYVPKKYKKNIQNWKQNNPSWEVKVWNYKDIEKEFPEYISIINNFNVWITKCDLARFLFVHKYGGVYIDMDIIFNKPFDDYITDREILLIIEPEQDIENDKGRIFNGFFAAIPQHNFIKGWIDDMSKIKNKKENENVIKYVFNTSGPTNFYEYYMKNGKDIQLENECLFLYKHCDNKSKIYSYVNHSLGREWKNQSVLFQQPYGIKKNKTKNEKSNKWLLIIILVLLIIICLMYI
jgi:mannosyltransferase OCH1-like enzyme